LNRPARRNAFDRAVRDGLIEAFDLARADDTIDQVHVFGAGPAFCSGGDLDEFGTFPDVVTAHAIRTERSVAARIDAVRDRVHVHLHGACIGAGIELPSFAGRVSASGDTVIRLPEVAMGLVPGAGGTVGITRRIGRWRCAYLALSGVSIDARTAREWQLVDELEDTPS
jgi:enoyl-CoA hydratase/carnithine racemase